MPRIRGARSSHDAVEAWRCKLGHKNRPEIHELFDIPKLVCGCGCGEKYAGDFDFCMGDVKVNGHRILGRPLVQGKDDRCVPFVYAKQMEVSKRMKALIQNKNPDDVPEMSPGHLLQTYKRILGRQEASGPTELIQMGLILKEEGIQSEDATTIYQASDVSVIQRNDTLGIVRALADGYPLNAGIFCGRTLRMLRYCRRYKPPHLAVLEAKMKENKRKFIPAHCVLLVGAGRRKGKMYYYFLNSWKRFCARRDSRGRLIRHGIGKVAACRLFRNVIRLSRFKEVPSDKSFVHQNAIPVTIDCPNYDLLTSRALSA